jgi:sugar-specific transcriptional regulator TrmB
MCNLIKLLNNIGLNEKEAQIYLAALELGESSIQDLAKKSDLKRTTLYYIIDELVKKGVIMVSKTGKKQYYIAEQPSNLLRNAKDGVEDFEDFIDLFAEKASQNRKRPRVYFLYGSSGFREAWDKILTTKDKEYRIITESINFIDYVKEKYILDEIIEKKKKLNISSRQIIVDSDYARKIVSKDYKENRVSKILSATHKLPFTEIITESMVIFISPRYSNMIFIIEDDLFAKTRRSLFEVLWDKI